MPSTWTANCTTCGAGRSDYPLVYREDSHAAGRHLAGVLRGLPRTAIRGEGSNGIVYDSIRREGGECAAGFRPRLLSNCRQERHLSYVWDGERVTDVYEKAGAALSSAAPDHPRMLKEVNPDEAIGRAQDGRRP